MAKVSARHFSGRLFPETLAHQGHDAGRVQDPPRSAVGRVVPFRRGKDVAKRTDGALHDCCIQFPRTFPTFGLLYTRSFSWMSVIERGEEEDGREGAQKYNQDELEKLDFDYSFVAGRGDFWVHKIRVFGLSIELHQISNRNKRFVQLYRAMNKGGRLWPFPSEQLEWLEVVSKNPKDDGNKKRKTAMAKQGRHTLIKLFHALRRYLEEDKDKTRRTVGQ
ncbi:hypothetical protein RvY_02797 [Ramazzottius varieornatus]|uniref:Uncharacterized protein n=1 Tax=Ramazzottius varieornatus TaxID=947166 RepID=A0A1D1UKZ6_RAMVA|nr:hypothetical protein RvY_02797 [Ramazzottius varieornatus]